MSGDSLHTMGQQHGRRSWAEPWKIKMVEPLKVTTRDQRESALDEAVGGSDGHETDPALDDVARGLHQVELDALDVDMQEVRLLGRGEQIVSAS